MIKPEELYTVVKEPRPGENPVLLHALAGFLDAGVVAGLVTDEILDTLEHEVVVRFDVDRLIDFRSRRPRMRFERDHWASYEHHSLVLHRVVDADGQPFLLLIGPEPDHYWNAFTAALLQIVDRFAVRLSVGFHGIPMSVPHTRPVGMTAHATDSDLLPPNTSSWIDEVEVPGSVNALFEYSMGHNGHKAMGFAVHVPHYLSNGRFADGSLHVMRAMADATGLRMPIASMAELADSERAELTAEVENSAEVSNVVSALEQQYDRFTAEAGTAGLPPVQESDLVGVDELAEQVEQFLRDQAEPPSDDPPLRDSPPGDTPPGDTPPGGAPSGGGPIL